MTRLDEITSDDLHEALEEIDGSAATLRIIVGLNYKHGVSQTEIAEWYDVSRSTVHNWLTDLEGLNEVPLECIVCDSDRSGRPRKLTEDQLSILRETIASSPEAAGYDASKWSPELVRRCISDRFDVRYSTRHARTILCRLNADSDRADCAD